MPQHKYKSVESQKALKSSITRVLLLLIFYVLIKCKNCYICDKISNKECCFLKFNTSASVLNCKCVECVNIIELQYKIIITVINNILVYTYIS